MLSAAGSARVSRRHRACHGSMNLHRVELNVTPSSLSKCWLSASQSERGKKGLCSGNGSAAFG